MKEYRFISENKKSNKGTGNLKIIKSLLYICLKLAWYFLITLTATTYYPYYGYLFLVACVIILFVGNYLLSKLFKR